MAMENGGRRDFERGLELLWGAGKKPSRGPKPGLSVEGIARAAIEVANAEGLEALSMRRVAHRLGFTTMALYRYVPGKAELIDIMLDVAIGEPPILDGVVGGWRAKLALWARGTWEIFHRHPWVLQFATSRRLMGPNELAWFESALRAVSGIGLTEREMVEVVGLVNGYVRGMAQVLVNSAQSEQRTVIAEEHWGVAYARLLERFDHDYRYPTLRGILASGVFEEPETDLELDDVLEFGLQRVLDGIERFIQSRSARLDR